MEYLSEEYMCAGWLGDLDVSMHRVLFSRDGCHNFFGRDPVSKEDYDKLRELFLAVNGWWRFDESKAVDNMVFFPHRTWYETFLCPYPKETIDYKCQKSGWYNDRPYNS
jgi:hypothetical protein